MTPTGDGGGGVAVLPGGVCGNGDGFHDDDAGVGGRFDDDATLPFPAFVVSNDGSVGALRLHTGAQNDCNDPERPASPPINLPVPHARYNSHIVVSRR